jgi:hypothetical protein
MRKCIAARRAGYHSEGYFSSDQEEDFRGRSDFFVRKFKNLEKGSFCFHGWHAVCMYPADPAEYLEKYQSRNWS